MKKASGRMSVPHFLAATSRIIAWTLDGCSALLLLFTIICFTFQPDRLAAFAVIPIWFWGLIGILLTGTAYLVFRTKASIAIFGIWIIVILFGADETKTLLNFRNSPPLSARNTGAKTIIRVITLNTNDFTVGDPSEDLAAWSPDIVLLQQIYPHHVHGIANKLFGAEGSYRITTDNGVATRWKIEDKRQDAGFRSQQLTVVMPDGSKVEIANIHLGVATTDLRFWKPSTWAAHQRNRQLRRAEMQALVRRLESIPDHANAAVIFGGDFNAPATDPIYRELDENFTDAFSVAGSGWGNTFHRRLPIYRIDHLYSTKKLQPLRCAAVVTRHSDHRFVVADFVLK